MSKRSIHIDHLQVRLPRNAAGNTRAIAGGLGKDVLRSLSEMSGERRGSMRIEEVSAGKVTGSSAGGIRKQAVDRIAAELAKRFE